MDIEEQLDTIKSYGYIIGEHDYGFIKTSRDFYIFSKENID